MNFYGLKALGISDDRILNNPTLLSSKLETIKAKFTFLKEKGLRESDILKYPKLLARSQTTLARKLEFLELELEIPIDRISQYPTLIYSKIESVKEKLQLLLNLELKKADVLKRPDLLRSSSTTLKRNADNLLKLGVPIEKISSYSVLLLRDPAVLSRNFRYLNSIGFEQKQLKLFDGDPNTGLYQSHHLDSGEKQFLQFEKLFILDQAWHGHFGPVARTELGVQLSQQLSDKILELMSINRDVNRADIEKVFGGLELFGRKISDWWTSNPDFSTQLREWNADRELIRKRKIRQYLANRFTLKDMYGNDRLDENGAPMNPVLDMYDKLASEAFKAFFLLEDINDFSYLFTDKDKELLRRYFKF
jgi:hypothetical protein